jgi:urease accessory protein
MTPRTNQALRALAWTVSKTVFKTVTLLLALMVGAAAPAWAHSPIEGMNSFYGGVLHPMLVPAHLVVLLALGLLLGGQAERPARIGAAVWLASVLCGLFLLTWLGGQALTQALMPVLLMAAAVLGLLVAAAWRVPTALLAALALAVGLGLALDSDPELGNASERSLALAGTALGAVLVLAAGLLLAEVGAQRGWQRIAVRVLGSWIAASAIMVSALSLVGTGDQAGSVVAGQDPAAASMPGLRSAAEKTP